MAKREISRVVSVTDTGILLTTTTTQEISYCTECPYHEQHGIVTPDSFEHDTGVYCSLVSADDDRNSHTYDGHVDRKLCFTWEWASEIKASTIPDWCPLRAEVKKTG